MFLGGNIKKNNVFNNILSIGYEFEFGHLSKMILYDDKLFNTDVNVGRFAEFEIKEDVDMEEQSLLTAVEDIEQANLNVTPKVINNQISDDFNNPDNFSFQISTDATNNLKGQITYYVKKDKLCDDEDDEDDGVRYKNNLYQFKTPTKTYKIIFAHNTKRKCFLFTDLELIITYYKIKQNDNIILETFVNAMSNVLEHLNELKEVTTGSLQILDKNTNDYNDIIDNYKQSLYNIPNTSIYYLTMSSKSNKLNDNLLVAPQMTFSCKIQHLFSILNEISNFENIPIVNDTIYPALMRTINLNIESLKKTNDIINYIYIVSNNLINSELIRNKYQFNEEQKEIIKNYIGLIIYKLYIYYNIYEDNPEQLNSITPGHTPDGYFKNYLSYNSRHTNYMLYSKLIEYINNINNNYNAVDVINDIILQPTILNTIIDDGIKLRKNVFLKTNILDVNNHNYGNPKYSLRSYFDHFNEPKILEYNEDELPEHDWLVSTSIDNLSSRMEIKDDIVLIECRSFRNLLLIYSYYYMRSFNFSKEHVTGVNFFKNFVDFYNNNKIGGRINNKNRQKIKKSKKTHVKSTSKSRRKFKSKSKSKTKTKRKKLN